MNTEQKIHILTEAAKYDVSCASSGSTRPGTKNGQGNALQAGICHSWAADGRCISLLKVLFSNACIYDCAYCINRCSNDVPRATFTVDELARLVIGFYKRNYIEGLFLSSGIVRNPDFTMEQMIGVARTLRQSYRFNGYIHLKAIPGASQELLWQAGFYADRLSANIELPSSDSLRLLAPDKHRNDVLGAIRTIAHKKQELSTLPQKRNTFAPAGQSTQLIVGASPENDLQIIRLAQSLYQSYQLKRVYYSAYVPVNSDTRLPALLQPPLHREHRLYQADWLLRFYQFSADEILSENHPFLDEDIDPKLGWALRHFDQFPVEINRASYHDLLRVPGLGVTSAQRIVQSRRWNRLSFEQLKKIGVVLKRAQYFITCNGKTMTRIPVQPLGVKDQILQLEAPTSPQGLLFSS